MKRDYRPMKDDHRAFVRSIHWSALLGYLKQENEEEIIRTITKVCLEKHHIEEESDQKALSFLISNGWGASCPCGSKDLDVDHSDHEYTYDTKKAWQMLQPYKISGFFERQKSRAKKKKHPYFKIPSFYQRLDQKRNPDKFKASKSVYTRLQKNVKGIKNEDM